MNMNSKENDIIYLAIPYTFNPELSFAIANEITAELMMDGKVVFSPISHSHPVCLYLPKELQFSCDFWLKQDYSILRYCSKLLKVVIGENGYQLLDDSKGCNAETKYASEMGIAIEYFYYDYEFPKETKPITNRIGL